jgi:hypothetical protein
LGRGHKAKAAAQNRASWLVCFSELSLNKSLNYMLRAILYSINARLCGGFPARVILACTQLLMQLPMLMHVHCKSCLTFGAKSKLPQLKVCPILAALKIKPCAAHNLSQCISARSAEKIWP